MKKMNSFNIWIRKGNMTVLIDINASVELGDDIVLTKTPEFGSPLVQKLTESNHDMVLGKVLARGFIYKSNN